MNKKICIIATIIISCLLFVTCIVFLLPTSTKNIIEYDNEVNKLSEEELNIYYNDLVNYNSNISINVSYQYEKIININDNIGYIMIPSLNLYENIGNKQINLYEKCEIPFKNTNTKMYINKIIPNNLKIGDIIYVKILNKSLTYVIDKIEKTDDAIDKYNANQTTLNIKTKTLTGNIVLKCILLDETNVNDSNVKSLVKEILIFAFINSFLFIFFTIKIKIKKYRIEKDIKKQEYYNELRKKHRIDCEDEIYEIGTVPQTIQLSAKNTFKKNDKETAMIQLIICGIIILTSFFTKKKER